MFLQHLQCVSSKKLDLGEFLPVDDNGPTLLEEKREALCKYQNPFISHFLFPRQCLWLPMLFQLVVCRGSSRHGGKTPGRKAVARMQSPPSTGPAMGPSPVSLSPPLTFPI